MVIVTHKSYDSVLVGTGKKKGLESLSENRKWRRIDIRLSTEDRIVGFLSFVHSGHSDEVVSTPDCSASGASVELALQTDSDFHESHCDMQLLARVSHLCRLSLPPSTGL